MATCFVIQPFDGGKFDKRFRDCFAPAIRTAGYEPYRVDQDCGVQVPIEAIQEGIVKSDACLVDITTDNPNVWYELGYATSADKPIVMVCSSERMTAFPFDVHHRTITTYNTDSSSDFDTLKTSITQRLQAIAGAARRIKESLTSSPVLPEAGMETYEVAILGYMLENRLTPDRVEHPDEIQSEVTRYGYTKTAVSLGLHCLLEKKLIELSEQEGYGNNVWYAYRLSNQGVRWVSENRERFAMSTRERATDQVVEYDPIAEKWMVDGKPLNT